MNPLVLPLIVVISLSFISVSAQDYPKPLPLGAEAPDFILPGVDDGQYWSLSDFSDS